MFRVRNITARMEQQTEHEMEDGTIVVCKDLALCGRLSRLGPLFGSLFSWASLSLAQPGTIISQLGFRV